MPRRLDITSYGCVPCGSTHWVTHRRRRQLHGPEDNTSGSSVSRGWYHLDEMAVALLGRADPQVEYGDPVVPWWAVCLLDLPIGGDLYTARNRVERGERNQETNHEPWYEVVDLARREYAGVDKSEVVAAKREWVLARALRSTRAFLQFIEAKDDELEPIMLKDFHILGISAMRRSPVAVVLWPYMHGKSANSSITVPLLDWAEQPESTQIRVYRTLDMSLEWTRKLMWEVESNEALHALCPWITRPEPGDVSEKVWGVRGFSIGGKRVPGYSFRPLTIGGTLTGLRADRIGVDDLVDENNSSSYVKQDRMWNTLKSGVLTTRRLRLTWGSPYGTKWGTTYMVGTIYDKRDVNWRMYQEAWEKAKAGDRSYKAVKVSVYPHRDSQEKGEVVWPEHRPPAFIAGLKEELGYRAFQMRLMNIPVDDGTEIFSPRDIEEAVSLDLPYGERPPGGCRLVIGYDPAAGKRTKGSAFPAAVLLGYDAQEDHWWFLKYERWAGLAMPQQIKRLADWAGWYGCPIVVEGNNIQESYADWMTQLHASVNIKTFLTTAIKHDQADGVESFQPLFHNRKVTICAKGAPDGAVSEFKSEWVQWPHGRYTDLLMASWFAKWELDLQNRRWSPGQATSHAPMYIRNRGLRRTVDLRRYRQ